MTQKNLAARILAPTVGGLALALLAAAPAAVAGDPCDDVAKAVSKACHSEARDDYWIAVAHCINADEDVDACRDEAGDELADAFDGCDERFDARRDLCAALGGGIHDPDFDPARFATEFDGRNPYFPVAVGNRWSYQGGDETIEVEVLDKTKNIEGVPCVVVRDVVSVDGAPIEDTLDWYAQAIDGDVVYCGEIALELETFPGDDPPEPEVVDIEGSWKAGRDDALPGTVMFVDPTPGTTYRQELRLGDAEDAAEVLSVDYGYGDDPELDAHVPADLAAMLCDRDCVVTRDFTPIEPDARRACPRPSGSPPPPDDGPRGRRVPRGPSCSCS